MAKNKITLDVSIIIVSWNVWDLLRACLNSIEQISRSIANSKDSRAFGPATLGAQAPTLEVIVVDNASQDSTVDLLPARFPWVRLIRSATNLGFTAGNNLGYASSRGRTIYFLNPDTELVKNAAGEESLWTLYRALLENPKVGLVGPGLRNGDNSPQKNRFRFPTELTFFFETVTLGRYWRNNPWRKRYMLMDWPATFRQEVDWVTGAAMLARREALEEIREPEMSGPFDESLFMYCEEVDLCLRLYQTGWKTVWIPEAIVIHYIGRSSGQVVAQRDVYHCRSKVRYAEKYFGMRWAKFFYIFVIWNFRIQLAIEGAKWLLGHKRPMRAERVTAYRTVLATLAQPDPRMASFYTAK
jgi:N-acetylglucosaminyl-diphospho-decaprenol L-rhamnosyltransferase